VLVVETSCGDFEITLDQEQAPDTAASCVALANAGFFDDTIFHRAVPDFVIQGGDPTGTGSGGPGYSTVDVPPSNAAYTRGVVAMAKTAAEAVDEGERADPGAFADLGRARDPAKGIVGVGRQGVGGRGCPGGKSGRGVGGRALPRQRAGASTRAATLSCGECYLPGSVEGLPESGQDDEVGVQSHDAR